MNGKNNDVQVYVETQDLKQLKIPKSLNEPSKFWTSRERRIWVVTLFIGTTVLFASRVAMPVCAMAMAREFDWNKEDLGTVMGCFFWGYSLTQIIGGYMADRVGGDRILCMAAVVWGSVTFITPHVAYLYDNRYITLLMLGVFRIFLGMSQGVHYPSMTSLLSHNIRESERSFSMGIVSSGSNFGSLLCGGLGSVILEHRGWQDVFHFIGFIAILGAAVTWGLSQSQQKKQDFIKLNSKDTKRKKVPWRTIFSKVPFWAAVSVHFANNATYFIWVMWLPTYFHERFPLEKGWVFNVVPWIISIPSSTFGGWLSDRIIRANYSVTFSRKFIESIAMIGSGVFGLILPYCTNYNAALLIAGAAVSCQTFHSSAVLVNPQDIAPAFAGSVFGIMNTAGAIPGFLGVYTAGYILHASGSWKTVFFSVFFTNIIGLTVFLIGGTGKKII